MSAGDLFKFSAATTLIQVDDKKNDDELLPNNNVIQDLMDIDDDVEKR